MIGVRFLAPAEHEINESARYYENQATGLGRDFIVKVESAIRDIAEHPERWPIVKGEIRRRYVRRFPFALLYQVEAMRRSFLR